MLSPPFPSLARASYPGGVDLGTAIVLPPGGEIRAYVRSTGPADGDPLDLQSKLVTTLNAGLARCRASRGDCVVVLPGHAENIATADAMSSLVAGTRIIGCGYGSLRPTFTWTAAAATFLFDVANTSIENCRLFLAGPHAAGTALTVAAPITVSAAYCSILDCEIFAGFDADQIVTIGITTTAAADDFTFSGNTLVAETAAECTTMIQFVGADRLNFRDNIITAASSAVGVGVVRFLTTASTNIRMFNNVIQNTKAVCETAVTGMAGLTGLVDYLWLGVLENAAAANIVLLDAKSAFETPASLQFGANVFCTNVAAETAAKMTLVST
jgi:hypothetical protein